MDIHNKEQRRRNMAAIKDKNTNPEIVVRKILHNLGYRFRLHLKHLPGKPDIVLKKYKTVVEVRGCYWHRHSRCKFCTNPATNVSFWNAKFEENVKRDAKTDNLLQSMGWKVLVVWECEVKDARNLEKRLLTEIN